MRRRSRFSNILRLSIIAIVALGGGFLSVFLYQNLAKKNDSQALSATEFQPGRIIDDSIFYNPNTMTAAEIDAFIDSHSPACDMWGNGYSFGGVQNKEYARRMREAGNSRWHEPPYVCISEFYENPETHVTNFETNGVKQPGMLSAGEIIYKAAQTYNVNPQVLLVMLKKESYAWGDDWPLKWEYNTVMGYACPDGAPCNEEYFGFYNQMMTAAWQLNYYREHIYSYNYRPYATNNILYNPDRSCGSKPVYLENIATTSLYIYTPYVPNDDALRNYPGTSWCGSYGNRNFYMYFREWFGDALEANADAKMAKERIEKRYEEMDGKTILGEKVGNLQYNPNTGIYFQQYKNGLIVGKSSTGYYESMGKIREVWAKSDYEFGKYGFPTSPIMTNSSTGIIFQQYQHGYIVGTDETGYFESEGKIRDYWAKTGFESGKLGFPVGNIVRNPGSGIYFQEYQNGYIVGSDKTGYYESMGKIREVWAKSGYEFGKYGFPTSPIMTNSSTGIIFQQYQHGYIVGTDETGYFESEGKIRDYWAKTGFESGKLGFPVGNIVRNPGSGIYFQEYQNGYIVGSDKTGYYESMGKIREVWAKSGYEFGKYGFPTSPIMTNSSTGIIFQQYQHGYIVGTDETGYFESEGKIRDYWAKTGFESGKLGFPVGNIVRNPGSGIYFQEYQNGYIVGSDKTGYYESMGKIREVWAKSGYEFGKYGFPTSPIMNSSTENFQKYEHGTIACSINAPNNCRTY